MYSVRILRRAVKDIANLPGGYARLVSQHIDRLGENPRPPDAKKLQGKMDYSLAAPRYKAGDEVTVSVIRDLELLKLKLSSDE